MASPANKLFQRIDLLRSLFTKGTSYFISKWLIIMATPWLLVSQPAYAQLSQEKMAGVMSIINSYLLGEGANLTLSLNEFKDSPTLVRDRLDIKLDTQAQDIEFCFFLSADRVVTSTNLILIINGVEQTGSDRPVAGENCYVIPVDQQGVENLVQFIVGDGQVARLRDIGIEPPLQSRLGLPVLTRSSWDERAVRKVLKIFAFGGHATDVQINTWGNMRPQVAINQMLNFSKHNPRLSPMISGEQYRETENQHGTLAEFYEYIGSESSNTPIEVSERRHLGIEGYRFASTFGRMVTVRGLNPFRQRIGFWETNYHIATNRDAGVSREQMVIYYDLIMQAHEQRLPYHEIMGAAAKSAAVAMQYGHRRNQWVRRRIDGVQQYVLEGNHDFAREIHQLFFGIFGANDPSHEDVTIDNTAKMLTDMRVPYINNVGFDTKVTFETDQHHRDEFGPLNILGNNITGVDAAAKIDMLMPISILHPESLFNLPVYIINTLADDSLTEPKRQQLRAAWARLGPNKDFLTFIHAYATSEMFHGDDHFKYLTSFERAYYMANRFNIDNIEAYLSNDNNDGRAGREFDDVFEGDNASKVFEPLNNVFGGQTSEAASDSAVAFEKNYNRSAAREEYVFSHSLPSACDGCNQGQSWLKDWTKVIPSRGGGYRADYVAQWLWKHAVGNLDQYTSLEKAHLVSILGAIRQPRSDGTEPGYQERQRSPFFDLNTLLCIREDRLEDGQTANSLTDLMQYDSWDDYCRHNSGVYSQTETDAFNLFFTGNQLSADNNDPFPYLRGLVQELSATDVGLTTSDPLQRRRANERVQAALAFIFATPFVFAEGN